MITDEDLKLALDNSLPKVELDAVLAAQPPVRWGPATPELLEAYARKAALQRGEAVALLQGLTPPAPEFGDEKIFFLDDFADVVTRFLRDCDAGTIPVPCRPHELAEWASVIGVSLPIEFYRAVGRGAHGRGAAPVTPEAMQADSAQPAIADTDPNLWQTLAEDEARRFRAENNKWPSKAAVARMLAKQIPVEAATIERRTLNTWKKSDRGQGRGHQGRA